MIVKKILAVTVGFIALVISVSAQEVNSTSSTTEKKYARPDIPGTFLIELGLNRPFGKPENFSLNLWGSRSMNVYYQYDMRILKSKFSFHPGIGLSMERYKFKNNYTMVFEADDSLKMISPINFGSDIRKSQLITNYLEIPLEFRFSTNPEDPTRSFKISIGARFGYLISSFNKIKYRDDGEKIKIKNKQDYGLNNFRYGIYAKIGAGNFSVFGYYSLTPLFKTGKGPSFNPVHPNTEIQNVSIGISLSSF